MWYTSFELKNKKQCALLSQAGSFSSYRFYGFIGRIQKDSFERVIDELKQLLFKK